MNIVEININKFDKLLNNNTALLCENGFSINFDSSFGNIFDRLYEGHVYRKKYSQYDIKSGELFKYKIKNNYINVKNYLLHFSENRIYRLFNDGLYLARHIIKDIKITKQLREKEYVKNLEFGIDELDIVHNISQMNDVRKINIEYWTILICIYHAIKYLNSSYKFPENNSFVTANSSGR